MSEKPIITIDGIETILTDSGIDQGWANHLREVSAELTAYIEYGDQEHPGPYIYIGLGRYDAGIRLDIPGLIRDFANEKNDYSSDGALRALTHLEAIIAEIKKSFLT